MLELNKYIPNTIATLGVDTDNELVIYSTDKRRLFRRKLTDLNINELVLIGGNDAVLDSETVVHEDFGEKANPERIIKRAMADASRQRTFATSETIGQGVWKVPGCGDRLLLVNGNRAWWCDHGKANPWTLLPVPMIDKHLIDIGANEWIDDYNLRSAVIDMTAETFRQTWDELLGYLQSWQFQQSDDHLVLAGLIFATCIQAFLDFRPQVWITGSTDSGKTAFKSFLSLLWPFAVEREGETSEAGVRQTVGTDSFPLLLDEQEAWQGRHRLVKTMRSATRGGVISKGTMSGKALDFRLNHISWWFSIESELPGAADRNRFTLFELVSQKKRKFKFPVIADLDGFRIRVMAAAIWGANAIKAGFRNLSGNETLAKHGRIVEVYALPVAVYGVATGSEVSATLDTIVTDQIKLLDMDSDEQKLIDAILMAIPEKEELPVAHFLQHRRKQFEDDPELVLAKSGIRLGDRNNLKPGYVFLAADKIKKGLLASTPWGGRNVKQQLLRIEGAVAPNGLKVELWSGWGSVNGVWVPREKLGLKPVTAYVQLPKPEPESSEPDFGKKVSALMDKAKKEPKGLPMPDRSGSEKPMAMPERRPKAKIPDLPQNEDEELDKLLGGKKGD